MREGLQLPERLHRGHVAPAPRLGGAAPAHRHPARLEPGARTRWSPHAPRRGRGLDGRSSRSTSSGTSCGRSEPRTSGQAPPGELSPSSLRSGTETAATPTVAAAATANTSPADSTATRALAATAPMEAASSAAIRPVMPTRACWAGAARVWRSPITSVMKKRPVISKAGKRDRGGAEARGEREGDRGRRGADEPQAKRGRRRPGGGGRAGRARHPRARPRLRWQASGRRPARWRGAPCAGRRPSGRRRRSPSGSTPC